MTQAKPRFKTLEEYAALDPSELPEGNYELVDGEIIELPAESDPNVEIASLLFSVFSQFVSYKLLRRGTEIFVTSRSVTSRYPDFVILTDEGRAAIKGAKRSAITRDMPAPRLVIEIVSPGDQNYNRDYVEKPQEYAARGIPEYWVIDRYQAVVTVLSLSDGVYRSREFRGNDPIVSLEFQGLQLTAAEIWEVDDDPS